MPPPPSEAYPKLANGHGVNDGGSGVNDGGSSVNDGGSGVNASQGGVQQPGGGYAPPPVFDHELEASPPSPPSGISLSRGSEESPVGMDYANDPPPTEHGYYPRGSPPTPPTATVATPAPTPSGLGV